MKSLSHLFEANRAWVKTMTRDDPGFFDTALAAVQAYNGRHPTAPLGIKLPLGIKRGYHRHYRSQGNAGLTRPIVDADYGYCLAPMEQGIRLTTGAEFAARDAAPTPDGSSGSALSPPRCARWRRPRWSRSGAPRREKTGPIERRPDRGPGSEGFGVAQSRHQYRRLRRIQQHRQFRL